MDLNRLPWRNLSHRPLRTAALLVLTFFLSFVIFAGSMTVLSLQNGLETLENRLGADIIVVPNTAKRKVDPKTMILDGTPGYFYMEREKMVLISHIEGVEKVSPQIFLASLSASCCSVPVQIIGFEPETDFIIQPWIRESYGRELAHGDVVVGSAVNADVGDTIRFYNKDCRIVAKLAATGTGLDTAVYTKAETIRTLIEASSKMGLNPLFEGDVENVISSVYIKVKDGYDIKKVTENINLRVRRVKAVQMKDMLSEIAGSLSGISKTITLLFAAVWVMVFIVLVVSFSVLVGERKKEFALLRVMGTSRRKLAGILLKETLILSVSGGAAGVLMGLLVVIPFSGLIETGLKLPFLLPGIRETGWLAFAAMVVICLAGPAASAYAVLRLSRVDPATILREGE